MKFLDRNDGGLLLAEKIHQINIKKPIVIAIPRGGIPVAIPIAQRLNSELKLSMTRKIGHPKYEEFAIGAVSLNKLLLSPDQQLEKNYIEESIEKERRRIREMIRIFDHEIVEASIKGKTVILVDDGIATGKTMELAVSEIRQNHPDKIIVCVPVCSIKAYESLQTKVDEVISLLKPASFSGIGAYYHHFEQLTDKEIIEMLKSSMNHQS
jgi:phosphoribosylpyrophosphate synthetase